jgi:hypothetical protein
MVVYSVCLVCLVYSVYLVCLVVSRIEETR